MARRSRHDTPAWAERFGDTPEDFDRQQVETEVRRHLRENTDPDEIDDPDVRARYLQRMQEDTPEHDEADGQRRHRANPRSGRAARSSSSGGAAAGKAATGSKAAAAAGAGKSSSGFSHPLHWGSGARGHTVGRPTLRPPSRLSVNDGTGFAFGLVLYALALSYIRYGPAGPRSWLSAKFLNRPTLGPQTASTGPATPLTPGRTVRGAHRAATSPSGGVAGPGF